MTRQEAINVILTLWKFIDRSHDSDIGIDSELIRQAFNLAIKALEEPERTGRCIWCDGIEDRRLRIEFYWIDDDGNTASFSEPHMVATGIAEYCPECGRRLKMGR